MTLPEKIRRRMKELGIRSGTDLARRLHKKQQQVSRWLRGEDEPDLENLKLLADTLDVRIEYLTDPNMTEPREGLSELEAELLAEARRFGLAGALRTLILLNGGSPAFEVNGDDFTVRFERTRREEKKTTPLGEGAVHRPHSPNEKRG